jgi:hypothetical protein
MSAAVVANPFHEDVFTHMRFNPGARGVVIGEDYDTMEMSADLNDAQISKMAHNMNHRFQAKATVVFRTPAIINRRAVWWTKERM